MDSQRSLLFSSIVDVSLSIKSLEAFRVLMSICSQPARIKRKKRVIPMNPEQLAGFQGHHKYAAAQALKCTQKFEKLAWIPVRAWWPVSMDVGRGCLFWTVGGRGGDS